MTMRLIRLGWLLAVLPLGLWGTSGCQREPSAAEQTANARRQVTEALANFQSVETPPPGASAPVESAATRAATPSDWSQWRGPRGAGVAEAGSPPDRWSRSEHVVWSAELPGWGTSSPVVRDDQVFVTSQTREAEQPVVWLLCFDRQTGRELWRQSVEVGVNQNTHEKSNLAVNTPLVTEDAVYLALGNAQIARYSRDGERVWQREYLRDFGDPKMAWGYSISPVRAAGAIVFGWDHHTGPCFLLGLDPRTGKTAWSVDRPIGTAHATPLLVSSHGRELLLVPGKNRLTAYDAQTQEELWVYGEGSGPFNGEIISSPVEHEGVVYLQLWRQSPIHALRLNAWAVPTSLWVSEHPGPVEPSLLVYQGHVYSWMDNGVLACLEAATGRERYRQRLGGEANSSPVAAAGRIYVSNTLGQTFVVRAGPKFELLATNDLEERITASPALLGNQLLLRTDSHLWLLGEEAGAGR
jgi:outer membrane protein assembly factor BamB